MNDNESSLKIHSTNHYIYTTPKTYITTAVCWVCFNQADATEVAPVTCIHRHCWSPPKFVILCPNPCSPPWLAVYECTVCSVP